MLADEESSFSVPKPENQSIEKQNYSANKRSAPDKSSLPKTKKICTREGKGTHGHGLRIVKTLLEDKENWKHISCKDDYQYLGVFQNEQMQVVYYAETAPS